YGSIGCLTGTARSGPVADRARGCAAELRDTGAAAGVVRTDLDRSRAHHDAREWLRQPDRPRALLATADGLALDVLNAAVEVGLRVPEVLAVMGFGATHAAAQSWPRLATVAAPFGVLAHPAVSLLPHAASDDAVPPDRVLEV